MALPCFACLHCVLQLQDHLLQICILVLRALSEEPSIAWGEGRVASSFWRANWLKIHVADMRHNLIKRDQGVNTWETWGAAWGTGTRSGCFQSCHPVHPLQLRNILQLGVRKLRWNWSWWKETFAKCCPHCSADNTRTYDLALGRHFSNMLSHADFVLFCHRKAMWQEGPKIIGIERKAVAVKDWNSEDRAYPTSSKKSTKFHRFDPGLEGSSL